MVNNREIQAILLHIHLEQSMIWWCLLELREEIRERKEKVCVRELPQLNDFNIILATKGIQGLASKGKK